MRLRLATLLFVLACPLPAWSAPDLVSAARAQIGVTLSYDPTYRKLAYPMGDVPLDRGVCTDVVVRAYRALGVDLQELVHRDMKAAFPIYQRAGNWGLKRPDPNIDHRRVPNLATWFKRHGQALPVSADATRYAPGDIVTWRVPPGVPHIGLVADTRSSDGTPLVIHNIGEGTRMEDRLFAWPVTGHYRFAPSRSGKKR
jgi:uncharacterized protein